MISWCVKEIKYDWIERQKRRSINVLFLGEEKRDELQTYYDHVQKCCVMYSSSVSLNLYLYKYRKVTYNKFAEIYMQKLTTTWISYLLQRDEGMTKMFDKLPELKKNEAI